MIEELKSFVVGMVAFALLLALFYVVGFISTILTGEPSIDFFTDFAMNIFKGLAVVALVFLIPYAFCDIGRDVLKYFEEKKELRK